VTLPVYRTDENDGEDSDEKPAIVIALDTSGSINDRDRNRFITLAKSIPKDKVKLFPITFWTDYVKIDLETANVHSYGGGTNFAAIQRYVKLEAEKELGNYPKAIIVITDGEGLLDMAQNSVQMNRKAKAGIGFCAADHPLIIKTV
jgi:predicted metal-dependent peptidase